MQHFITPRGRLKGLGICSHFLGWNLPEHGGVDGSLALASPAAEAQHIRWSSFLSETMYVAQDADPRLERVTGISAR